MKMLQSVRKTEYQVTGRSVRWNERGAEQRNTDSGCFAGWPETRFFFLLLLRMRALTRNRTRVSICWGRQGALRSTQDTTETVCLVPKHGNKANTATRRVTQVLWFPGAWKSYVYAPPEPIGCAIAL